MSGTGLRFPCSPTPWRTPAAAAQKSLSTAEGPALTCGDAGSWICCGGRNEEVAVAKPRILGTGGLLMAVNVCLPLFGNAGHELEEGARVSGKQLRTLADELQERLRKAADILDN